MKNILDGLRFACENIDFTGFRPPQQIVDAGFALATVYVQYAIAVLSSSSSSSSSTSASSNVAISCHRPPSSSTSTTTRCSEAKVVLIFENVVKVIQWVKGIRGSLASGGRNGGGGGRGNEVGQTARPSSVNNYNYKNTQAHHQQQQQQHSMKHSSSSEEHSSSSSGNYNRHMSDVISPLDDNSSNNNYHLIQNHSNVGNNNNTNNHHHHNLFHHSNSSILSSALATISSSANSSRSSLHLDLTGYSNFNGGGSGGSGTAGSPMSNSTHFPGSQRNSSSVNHFSTSTTAPASSLPSEDESSIRATEVFAQNAVEAGIRLCQYINQPKRKTAVTGKTHLVMALACKFVNSLAGLGERDRVDEDRLKVRLC